MNAICRSLTVCFASALLAACAAAPLPAENPQQSPKERAPLTAVIVDPAHLSESRVVEVADVGLAAPESVIHDVATDTYLVSNINGSPLAVDNNGFISKLYPDGRVIKLKFIEGGQNQVTLNAPKGMAIIGRTLYVADLNAVRGFDLDTGAPKSTVTLENATFLNDLSAGPDGSLYVSDSGIKDGFAPSGTDAVYRIDTEGHPQSIASGTSLGQPNGVSADATGVWVVTFSGELYHLNNDGTRAASQKAPSGKLDGVVHLDANSFLISSWDCGCVYRTSPGGAFVKVADNLTSPADINYDAKRNRLLVPIMLQGKLEAHSLSP
ncbi:MAG TPA: hypothetical protein VL137_02020 [Polyangiaceae bacterium]|nr:hypothetical protein [Polyangiaceae bacterium]